MNVQAPVRGSELVAGAGRIGIGPEWLAHTVAGGMHKVLDRIHFGLAGGSIAVTLPDGTQRLLGGRSPGFDAVVTLHDWHSLLRLATGGSVGWYQAWEAGEWSSPDPVPLFALFMANGPSLGDTARAKGAWRLAMRGWHWLRRNTRAGSRKNIHAHYDLGNDFYAAWLDRSMSYSSAIFWDKSQPSALEQMTDALGDGQLGKVTEVVGRMQVGSGDRALEIGCGWGMLAFALSAKGVRVDAISLSDEQLASCRARMKPGDTNPAFLKRDYRDVTGQYDAIASVEMVEALGRAYWPSFMDVIARSLVPGGRAAIQFISIADELFDAYAASADFIQTYVFPGGMLIRTSEFRRLAEARGLDWVDQADFGLDYAETLRLWRVNFDRAVEEGRLPAGFDARFVRLWRYYLMYCEGGFRGGGIDVSQVTLVKR